MKTIITIAAVLFVQLIGYTSELFIRVNTVGSYFVSISDQTHYNGNNIFKFSNLPDGVLTLQVVNRLNNTILYNGTISLRNNERTIAQIDAFGQLTVLQKIQIQEVNWYTVISNENVYSDPNFGNTPGNQPYPSNGQFLNVVNTTNFNKFITTLKNESMDNNRLKMAKVFASNNALTSDQVAKICKELSFDNNRLEFAKHAYSNCYDKSNYYLLRDSFGFSSNYNSLLDYIGN